MVFAQFNVAHSFFCMSNRARKYNCARRKLDLLRLTLSRGKRAKCCKVVCLQLSPFLNYLEITVGRDKFIPHITILEGSTFFRPITYLNLGYSISSISFKYYYIFYHLMIRIKEWKLKIIQNHIVFATSFSSSNSRGKLKNCKINKHMNNIRTIIIWNMNQ